MGVTTILGKKRFRILSCLFLFLFSLPLVTAKIIEGQRNSYGVFRLAPPRRFEPLTLPVMESVRQSQLSDNDWVIGVNINNDPKCYPTRQMWYHHVVNDIIGGENLSVTY